jgi:formylglycine-generating enzyme required for sulfatase activity
VQVKTSPSVDRAEIGGNVWERCNDWYSRSYYSSSAPISLPDLQVIHHVFLRGGGWYSFALGCRVAYRTSHGPDYRDYGRGFRVSLSD